MVIAGILSSRVVEETIGVSGGVMSAGTLRFAVIGGIVGYLAHLALDASTKSGIWLLLPKDRRVGLPKKYAVRTGSPTELLISGGLALLTLMLGIAVFAPRSGQLKFFVRRRLICRGLHEKHVPP